MMSGKLSAPTRIAIALLFCAIWTSSAIGQGIIESLPRPAAGQFVLDLADLLSPGDEQAIRARCAKLDKETATPIIVVTIKSMADHGGRGMRIETFARLLFDQWGVGYAKVNNKNWNTGILLLVSRDDRKARIELGAGWKHDKDDICSKIMEGLIIPKFKSEDFPGGILAGVAALDNMAHGLKIPKPSRPMWHYLAIAGFIGLAIFTVVSLHKKGSSGWAWLFWGAVFALGGLLLYSLLSSSSRGGGGGGGGGFGGGFSGGGGATGSW